MPLPLTIVTRFALGASCLLLCTVPSAVAANELDDLRSAWRRATTVTGYTQVAEVLIAYRNGDARYAKTAEIDYMIATSLCRIPEKAMAGHRHFSWILQNFSLGAEDYRLVMDEQRRCGRAGQPLTVAFAMLPVQGGGAGIRSKLYYWIGRDDAAINTEPAKFTSPKDPDVLLGRLYTADRRQEAVEAVSTRVDGIRRVGSTEHFVLVSLGRHSASSLREIGQRLERFLAFYIEAYKLRPPSHLVTVYLAPSMETMRDLAKDLHGLQLSRHAIGYTFRDDLSILAVIPTTAIGTLAHELFHLLVRDVYGDLPPWLDEGTAALYEVSNISAKFLPGRPLDVGETGAPTVGAELAVRGIPNWRGCVLRKIWIEDYGPERVQRPTIAELIGMDWRAFDNLEGDELAARQAVIHATARYFVLYLQDVEKKLFPVFADIAMRDPFEISIDPAEDAKLRVAAYLGDLDSADARFDAWLKRSIQTQRCQ